ncbi:unnamed protein product [[Candida] boidinii]|nr:unnamed protein product [[Candida] boidinii]
MSEKRNLLIGVDVGGTNSDLVVIDPTKLNEANRGVLAWHKSVTTPDVSDGIENAIRIVLENPDNKIKKEEISSDSLVHMVEVPLHLEISQVT